MTAPDSTSEGQATLESAIAALQSGAHAKAAGILDDYLANHPEDVQAIRAAIEAHRGQNHLARAIELLRAGIKFAPDDRDFRVGFIDALMQAGELHEARACAEAAATDFHGDPMPRIQLAQIDMALGDTGRAQATLRSLLAEQTDNVDAMYHLAEVGSDDDLVRLADLITSVWQTRDAIESWQGRTLTGYTRGKVLEKLGRYEEAWEGYAFGAKARREAIGYNEDAYAQLHDAHRKLFTTAQLTSDPPPSDGGGQHVFIVSLPRSGSTLVEQIVSAHEAVETIGEQNIAAQAVNYWQKTHGPSPATLFKPAALADARAFYVGKARELVGREEAMIVDKSITNYVLLGFLHAIMPEARFLHVTRAPMDTGLSCFTTSFHSGNQWTYDLAEIGRNIRRYQGLMKHWMKLCPEQILSISYETLVSDVETKTREIVSFCNLAWDPACLAFHESKAVVRTASVAQVRRPVYQTAKDRAAHFAAHLGPLRAALGRAADADWYRTPSQTQ